MLLQFCTEKPTYNLAKNDFFILVFCCLTVVAAVFLFLEKPECRLVLKYVSYVLIMKHFSLNSHRSFLFTYKNGYVF